MAEQIDRSTAQGEPMSDFVVDAKAEVFSEAPALSKVAPAPVAAPKAPAPRAAVPSLPLPHGVVVK